LSTEERSLLCVAYKYMTNTLRNSWKVVGAWQEPQSHQALLIERQKQKIENELIAECKDILRLLDKDLLPAVDEGEETVFYFKLKGDYCRYLAELGQKKDRDRFANLALKAYKRAYRHALATLHPLHSTKLGLALNFSVFFSRYQAKSREGMSPG